MFYQLVLSFSILMFIFIFLLFYVQSSNTCAKIWKYMLTLKNNLCYIENDDAINFTMQIPSTYVKFVFTQFSKKIIK
jgi:hypothetical protein